MKKVAVALSLGFLVVSSPLAQAGPFSKAREKQAEEKSRVREEKSRVREEKSKEREEKSKEREEKSKEREEKVREKEEKPREKENRPAPAPVPPENRPVLAPVTSDNRPAPSPDPQRPRRDRDRDSDDKIRRHDNDGRRDRDDNWNRPHTVIIERPVYIPIPVPPYYPESPYQAQARREDALLEAVAKQMRFALREDPVLKPFKLDTDTVGDSVEIEGLVDTIAQLQLALDVARNIDPRTRIVITRIKVRQR